MLFSLKPTRDQSTPIQIISDLDALISKPIGFKFGGKAYQLKPVDTRTFLHVAEKLSEIQTLIQKPQETVNQDDIYAAYFGLIGQLCPEFKMSDLKSMALPQIHALINLIVKHITGQTESFMVSEEKKNP